MNKWKLYYYRAKVISVYDGDTCRVKIDLGFKTWIMDEKIRLARINSPELRGIERQAGLKSRNYLRELILGKKVILETLKDRKGKYGRYLGEIWVEKDNQWHNISDEMVKAGMAEYFRY